MKTVPKYVHEIKRKLKDDAYICELRRRAEEDDSKDQPKRGRPRKQIDRTAQVADILERDRRRHAQRALPQVPPHRCPECGRKIVYPYCVYCRAKKYTKLHALKMAIPRH